MGEPRIFRMPALGADMTEGSVLEWVVHPGDTVRRGDVLAVVKTDKADVEAESFDDGIVGELLVLEGGEPVPIGTPLATIVEPGAAPTTAAPPAPAPAPAFAPASVPAATPTAIPTATPTADLATTSNGVIASPYARRRAHELGVDLAHIQPAQPGHPITAADVERAAAQRLGAEHKSPPVDQHTAMRRAIGNLMARSKREIPHYYLEEDIELTHALAWLAHHNEQAPIEARILPAALLYKAVALAARDVPELNGSWIDGAFVPATGVHLGIAISLRGGGLVAPAIHDADQLSLTDLMVQLRDLSARARGGRLRSSEMTDATLTVTNLGEQGVRSVVGVIYVPQVALVGFGKITERVWGADGGISLRPVVTATLSADHRATDGHIGARLLVATARYLHRPEEL